MSPPAPPSPTEKPPPSTPPESPTPPSPLHPTPPFDPTAEARLLRKLDLRVLPVLWLLFLVCFIDRSNIGNAKIAGMERELELRGQRYNVAVFVFNVGYLVAGVPLSVVVKRYGPRSLGVMMFCWGVAVIGCGVTKSWAGLVVCRLVEGMAESAYVPGAAYVIGSYYKKNEFLKRYVIFFSAGICSGAVNGFIATLISKMDGAAGYQAWRWIFIIEGLITILISLLTTSFIVPFPKDSTFLSPPDKALLLARLNLSTPSPTDPLSPSRILSHLRDWKIWAALLMYLGAAENANSITGFQPTILRGIGYTATAAQVRTIPVYLVAAIYSITLAHIAATLNRRFPFALLGFATIVVGLAIEIAQPKAPGVRYAGLFFMTAGAYLVMPLSVVWLAVNVEEGYKRSVALGAIVCFGNAGAFVGTNVFLKREEPRFRTGFAVGMGLCCMGVVAACGFFGGLWMGNRRRDGRNGGGVEGNGIGTVFVDGNEEGSEKERFRYSL